MTTTTLATDVKTRALAALRELGAEPDDVADRLRALGIKGTRGLESMCPIALYLARQDKTWVAEVFIERIWIQYTEAAGELITHAVDFLSPDPVSLFVRRFDRGVYPDLADGSVA